MPEDEMIEEIKEIKLKISERSTGALRALEILILDVKGVKGRSQKAIKEWLQNHKEEFENDLKEKGCLNGK